MRRILQRVREMSDERKTVVATTVSAALTAVIAAIWGASFIDFVAVETEPAAAVDAQAGPIANLMDQLGTLFSELEVGPIVSTSTESQLEAATIEENILNEILNEVVSTTSAAVTAAVVVGTTSTSTATSTAVSASTTQNYFYQAQ